MCASFCTSPACTPAFAFSCMSFSVARSATCAAVFGMDGAQPVPGVSGAATLAFSPSGVLTSICCVKKLLIALLDAPRIPESVQNLRVTIETSTSCSAFAPSSSSSFSVIFLRSAVSCAPSSSEIVSLIRCSRFASAFIVFA